MNLANLLTPPILPNALQSHNHASNLSPPILPILPILPKSLHSDYIDWINPNGDQVSSRSNPIGLLETVTRAE